MCPKYVILIVLYFCLQFMSAPNYFRILFCDLSLCDLCFGFLSWFCFYFTRSALQVHLQPLNYVFVKYFQSR